MIRLVLLLSLLTLAAGCTDHFTTQEAYTQCEEIIERVATTTDDAFAACVACYEDCGEDCEQSGASPPEFTCPD